MRRYCNNYVTKEEIKIDRIIKIIIMPSIEKEYNVINRKEIIFFDFQFMFLVTIILLSKYFYGNNIHYLPK